MPTQTCWCCNCCWWGLCRQQFVAGFEAEVLSKNLTFVQTLSTRFGQDFEVAVQARFWGLSLVSIEKKFSLSYFHFHNEKKLILLDFEISYISKLLNINLYSSKIIMKISCLFSTFSFNVFLVFLFDTWKQLY